MNKIEKIFNLWLMAALVCGLSLSVSSCKDDDDDSKSEEQLQQEQAEKASKFWSVVGQLVSSDSYDADYQDKTFEPTYGIADSQEPLTRIVETNDMQTAASYFADLISVVDGSAIDENTPTYTYSDPEVGTLAYTRGGTANEWATVDVSIKQLPRLRKIVYRQGGEGTNGNFPGKAYYRFGDVVSRTNKDGQTEYWICVRPAFSPEDKSDSHWVCLNTVPVKNQYHVSGSNGKNYYVPTGVGTNNKNMQNLAEMLYAIVHPQQWYTNADHYHTDGKLWGFSGLPIFNDFKKANLMYHNQYFWQKVADGWEKHDIARRAMNTDLGKLAGNIDHKGITLLYNGYSWWSKTSWNCTLYQASYTNGTSNDKLNLHNVVFTKPEKNMKSIQFDCREMGDNTENYQGFFGDDKLRWVIRHATGEELNGGTKLAPTAPLQGAGIKTVYRYYDEYKDEWNKNGPNGKSNTPEVTADPADISNAPMSVTGVYQWGDVLECIEDGTKWFCLLGKPESDVIPCEDQEATFVSLDIPEYNGVKAQGLPTEAELPEYAYRFLSFLQSLNTANQREYILDPWANGQLGKIGEHIKQYAGVDLYDLILIVDSVWRFKDKKGKYLDSESSSILTNMAYDDGSNDHQAVARIIHDYTQAGGMRNTCDGTTADGKNWQYRDWYYRIYKHYELFDTSRQTALPAGWDQLEATAWQWLWPTSDTRITLQDLTNQELVTRYAAADKWVRLPIKTGKNTISERRTPRTQAETAVSPADFFYKNRKFATAKRNMWNEPVLFMRFAKIKDPGQRTLNLVSTDGRHFKVVHLQNDKTMYNVSLSSMWALPDALQRSTLVTVDNVMTVLPPIPGLQ